MSLRNSTPLTFNPRGLSDTLDGSTVFAGAMSSLQNLVPDPSTRSLWQCRPAAIKLTDFTASGGAATDPFSSGFSPGFGGDGGLFPAPLGKISCLKVIGNIAYGMIATGLTVGHDQPFAYNLSTNTFGLITGITSANTPLSPANSGPWIPPKMALVGHELLVTHPGYSGAGGVYFGWFDVSNPSAITWNGGNLTGLVTFTTAPSCVENFGGRAYWITNPPTGQPALIFSDVLVPRTVTNANQVLTFDDNVALTALAPLPLNNQLGGIVQALIVFKGVQNMYQVTGDAATSNLTKNALNVATGTLAPNSISSTPKGLAFIAPDGLRMIDFNGNVGDPVGTDGMGKTLPFFYAVVPSRMYGSANGQIYRISVQDGSLLNSPTVEYWYDMTRQIWSGPHTFPASCIAPWNGTFIVASFNVISSLWQSDYVQTATSTFVENGTPMSFTWNTCMLPDTNKMCENAMIETTIYMGQAPGGIYAVYAANQNGSVFQSLTITNTSTATVWGQFTWGQALWGGSASALFPRRIPWAAPIVFRRMQIVVVGTSSKDLRVGTLHLRYEQLGYLQESDAA
jgi:hypothetical protein